MKNFIFKSIETDLQKNSAIKVDKLDILMKNVLYCTHQLDKILVTVKNIDHNSNLQKQVDEFFEDEENIPEVNDGSNKDTS